MKTDVNKFTARVLLAQLAAVAPSIAIETKWEHDPDLRDIRTDCDGMDDEDPRDWKAWQSEVRAFAVFKGGTLTGSAYLGGTWEKAGDNPWKSNPEISGYLPQMIEEAVQELATRLPANSRLRRECEALLAII